MTETAQPTSNKTILSNGAYLTLTTLVTSGLGFAYWWVAARLFSAEAVGLAFATTSVMLLLATIGLLGLETLLISELPKANRKGELLFLGLLVVGGVSLLLGLGFALVAPRISGELAPFFQGVPSVLYYSAGVGLCALTFIFDAAMIGLLRGDWHFWRNLVFSLVKLALLFVVNRADPTGLSLYNTWLISLLLSLAAAVLLVGSDQKRILHRPAWSRLQHQGRRALEHYLLNLSLQAPRFLLPLLVTVLVSAAANASFSLGWQLVSFAFMVPSHLASVLHAVGSGNTRELSQKLRFTLLISLAIATFATVFLALLAPWLLSLFGSEYVASAFVLKLLALAVVPTVIKFYYVTVCRVQENLERAMYVNMVGAAAEIVFACIGAYVGGLEGLAVGLLVTLWLQALIMSGKIYSVATRKIEAVVQV
jgi:O-antigen/teichoic acid export membrane protein